MIGKTISHYKILEKLGGGGMGVVYKAQDLKLDRFVALKFLPPELTRDEESKKRFIHEAKAASALDHSNICTIYEIDETDEGQLFIAMAFYEGETLKKKIEGGPLKILDATNIILQITEGLTKAHEKNIIHRDIKPANIFITNDGVVKILDFGLAKVIGQTQLTQLGTTIGTAAYMSPEQARGETVDNRTDIWSLGVVLYEMITGQQPFKGDYEQAVTYSIINEDPQTLTGLRTGVPMEIEQIVNKCLEKEPSIRYQHTDEITVDFERLNKELKSGVVTSRKFIRPEKPRKRYHTFTIPVILLIVILLIVAGYFFLNQILQKKKPEAETIGAMKWENSIAVLPFRDFSPEKDQEYFCDGMTDALNDKLSKIGELKIISTTSIMRYKNTDKDIKVIGAELGVANIVEGTIQKEENRIRVRAQLINAETGFQLWSNTYDQQLESVFDVQDEISKSIAGALKVKLSLATLKSLITEQPKNMESYEYYLKGMHFIKSKYVISFQEEDFEAGVQMFKKVVKIDPDYALAYFGLAWAYEHHYQVTGNKKDSDKMQKMCEKAYKLDPNSALMNALMGYYYYEYKGEYDKAFQFHKRALFINPNIGEVNFLVGVCFLYHGLYHKGIKYLLKAFELDPYYFWTSYKLAMCYMNIGEFGKAALYFEKYFELAPVVLMFPGRYIALKIRMKEYEKVEELINRTEKTHPGYWGLPYSKALLLAAKGEKDKAIKLYKNSEIYSLLGMKDETIKSLKEEIRKSVSVPYIFYYDLLNNPFYKNLRNDRRFEEILQEEKKLYEENFKKYSQF